MITNEMTLKCVTGFYRYGSNNSDDIDLFVDINLSMEELENRELLMDIRYELINAIKSELAKDIKIDMSFIKICQKEGIVIWSEYEDTAECNNALFNTFNKHAWNNYRYKTNPISRELPQVVSRKLVMTIRAFLTYLSRTEYRSECKRLLKTGTFKERLAFVSSMVENGDFYKIPSFYKNIGDVDVYKDICFHFAQVHCLINGYKNVFTKNDAALRYPYVADFILKTGNGDVKNIGRLIDMVLSDLSGKLFIYDELDGVRYMDEDLVCQNKTEKLITIT